MNGIDLISLLMSDKYIQPTFEVMSFVVYFSSLKKCYLSFSFPWLIGHAREEKVMEIIIMG